jgi:hypothetical protein
VIDEFDHERLWRRRHFLESRATAHLNTEADRRWHRTAAATLLRDAASLALLLDEFEDARNLFRRSGGQLLQLGLSGGLQLLFIAGAVDEDGEEIWQRIDTFAGELFLKESPEAGQRLHTRQFDEESFRAPQLLRTYQGLAGRRSDDPAHASLRQMIRGILTTNVSMPVGAARTPAGIYLAVFDYLANRQTEEENLPGGLFQIIRSLAQRRAELLSVAWQDRYHWKTLLRPAELIDLDLLAMFVAGRRRGQNFGVIASAFAERDSLTALPAKLAMALNE